MAETQKAPDKAKMVKIGLVVVIFGVIGWQVMGMFSEGGGSTAPQQPTTKMIPNPDIPKPAKLMTQQVPAEMTDRERQLMALQQQTEAKYITAMNELQMLRIEKEIAVTNKEISAARLDTVAAQKGIVELLTPPKPQEPPALTYSSGSEQAAPASSQQIAQGQQGEAAPVPAAEGVPTLNYTVVSVSRLRGKWQAVLSLGGKLYHVSVGDVLGAAGSVVIAIDQSGVLFETKGKQQKISMVPII